MEKRILDKYTVVADRIKGSVEIVSSSEDFVPLYIIRIPELEKGTLILLDKIREILVTVVKIRVSELIDPKSLEELKERFYSKSLELIEQYLPGIPMEKKEVLAGTLLHEMLGLGKLEMLLADGNLEEIVVNSSKEPVWVYHRKYGWLKTNIQIPSEIQIQNYAASIGRRVGRQITTLDPLLDAHLISGDRVNATLFPISTIGNTLTIRMFRRKPWTITDFIENKTISPEVTAMLWLGVQYEMSMIISGGTASGKTSFLGAIMPFIQPNQRIVSIEDTRELSLPQFLHWVPLTTREPNPEGKGAVEMLDLLVNSLRMRPDRIVVGEIRRQAQAEVLFEAMHTGHSVYATLHADTVEQTYRRLINPPINVPETLLEALDLIIAMFRDRRSGIRRIYQVAEILPPTGRAAGGVTPRVLYRWDVRKDKIEKIQESYRFLQKLQMHTGMSTTEIEKDKNDKIKILNWLVENQVNTVNGVGKVVAEYYRDPEYVLNIVERKEKAEKLISKDLLVS
ncbi:MAG: type II/IV secretion system ATPase subunit [Candidatus Aenigmarchaeota archaeon]|nr:type II/IV secretion system ATPase subunit [Candidatus Aenigmarchaeota archaeon]